MNHVNHPCGGGKGRALIGKKTHNPLGEELGKGKYSNSFILQHRKKE